MIYLTRKAFLKAGAYGAASLTVLNQLEKYLYALEKTGNVYSFQREILPFRAIPSICHQCQAGCGIFGLVVDDELVGILGNPNYPANKGAICSRAASMLNLVYDKNRILTPLKRKDKRGGKQWQKISWDQAAKEISAKLNELKFKDNIIQIGADEGCTSAIDALSMIGNFMIIDDHAAENLNRIKGHEQVWGEGPGVPDFAGSRYILNFGANPYESGDQYIPLVKKLISGRVDHGAKMVTFDVRLSNTAGKSDEWFPVRPGSDAAVIYAMCGVIIKEGLADDAFLGQWTNSSSGQIAYSVGKYTPEFAQAESGVSAEDIKRVAIEFATRKPSVAICGGGLTDKSSGINNQAAVLLLNAVVGGIDRKGGYCLPKKYKFDQPAVKTSALDVASLYNEGKKEPGIYMSYLSNPVYRDSSGVRIRKILESEGILPLYVAIDTHITETSVYADIILPAATQLEGWGIDSRPAMDMVPYVGLRRQVIKPLGTSKSLSAILTMIGNEAGIEIKNDDKAFVEEFIRGARLPQGTSAELFRKQGFFVDTLKPTYESYRYTGFKTGKMNLQSAGRYHQSEAKADISKGRLYLTTYTKNVSSRLNPNSKWLSEISHENLLMINTGTAQKMGLKSGDMVEIKSNGGKLNVRVQATQIVHPEVAAIAREHGHWEYGNFAKGRKAESEDDDTLLVWWNNKKSYHIEALIESDINIEGGVKSKKNVIAIIKKAG